MTNEELFKKGLIEDLYNKNIKMFHYICHRYERQLEYNEAFSLCNLGFMKAYRTYNPDKAKWITYLTRCLLNELNRTIYYTNRDKRFVTVSLQDLVKENNAEIELADTFASSINIEQQIINRCEAEEVKRIISGLTEKYKEVLDLRVKGYGQKEISKILGITMNAVNSRYMRSKALIRKRLLSVDNQEALE